MESGRGEVNLGGAKHPGGIALYLDLGSVH